MAIVSFNKKIFEREIGELDEKMQEQAEKIVKDEAVKLVPYKAENAAAVILNPQILPR